MPPPFYAKAYHEWFFVRLQTLLGRGQVLLQQVQLVLHQQQIFSDISETVLARPDVVGRLPLPFPLLLLLLLLPLLLLLRLLLQLLLLRRRSVDVEPEPFVDFFHQVGKGRNAVRRRMRRGRR